MISSSSRWLIVRLLSSQADIHIVAIYGATDWSDKVTMWQDLLPIIQGLDRVIVRGDFNKTMLASKRSSGLVSYKIFLFMVGNTHGTIVSPSRELIEF